MSNYFTDPSLLSAPVIINPPRIALAICGCVEIAKWHLDRNKCIYV